MIQNAAVCGDDEDDDDSEHENVVKYDLASSIPLCDDHDADAATDNGDGGDDGGAVDGDDGGGGDE